MLLEIDLIPSLYILFLPMEKVFKLGVPSNPLAIYAAPRGPKPQLLIKKT